MTPPDDLLARGGAMLAVWEAIAGRVVDEVATPTKAELAAATGLSPATVWRTVRLLEAGAWLTVEYRTATDGGSQTNAYRLRPPRKARKRSDIGRDPRGRDGGEGGSRSPGSRQQSHTRPRNEAFDAALAVVEACGFPTAGAGGFVTECVKAARRTGDDVARVTKMACTLARLMGVRRVEALPAPDRSVVLAHVADLLDRFASPAALRAAWEALDGDRYGGRLADRLAALRAPDRPIRSRSGGALEQSRTAASQGRAMLGVFADVIPIDRRTG